MYVIRPETLPFGTHNVAHFSDLHIGSAETNEKAIKKELEYAAEQDAWMLFNGDLADAIIASDNKRYRPSALHKRLRGRTDILNATLDWQYELLEPYKKRILMIGDGNHETYIEQHCSVDLGLMLADKLGVPYGGYTGFIDWTFDDGNRHVQRFVEFYHHGAGGGKSVSSAASDLTATGSFIDADLIWLGHKHHRLTAHMRRVKCPRSGVKPLYADTRYLMTGSYMEVWGKQKKRHRSASYAEDKKLPPQGIGGAMVQLDVTSAGVEVRITT